MRNALAILLTFLSVSAAFAQTAEPATAKALAAHERRADRDFEEVIKTADDLLWCFRLGDIASVDKVHYTSSKPERTSNPTDQGAGNPMIIPAYVFTPKSLRGKAPMIVLVQRRRARRLQHILCAHRARADGWSHGGYQTLMNIFKFPDAYQVAYAGVPVSDLVQRYRRRSPYFHAADLKTPLLIHTNTNDEDVNVMEVEHLIDALKAAGRSSNTTGTSSTALIRRSPGSRGKRSTTFSRNT
jgi:hypothetical protein